MAAVNEQGSPAAPNIRLQTLLDYCRTVVRPGDTRLQAAMQEYAGSLSSQPHRS